MNDIVYQVRSVDAFGKQTVIHAYATMEAAEVAMKMMKKRTSKRYVAVPVKNMPNQHWGINTPHEVKPKTKRR